MDFAKQFTEAAQKAVLTAVENGSWVNYPWMENMVKGAARESLKPVAMVKGPIIVPDFITEPAPCGVFHRRAGDQGDEVTRPAPALSDGSNSFESNDFTHVDGYDYRIVVIDRMKNSHNSWCEHFKQKPTQEEFEYQFRHFHAHTHYVHVNLWVDGTWETITTEYVPHWNKEKPKETLKPSEEWPEGKKFRVKFWDQRISGYNYVYFDSKPGGIVLNKYHSAKCFAVVQSRPEGV